MKQVLVIEQETSYQNDLKEIIQGVDSELYVLAYNDLRSFLDDLKLLKSDDEEKKAECRLDLAALSLVIIDKDLNKKVSIDLWKKITEQIEENTEDSHPIKFILTGHDSPNLYEELKEYTDFFIFNLLVKPFDKIVCQQLIKSALSDAKDIEVEELYTHESSAQIEMIKEVKIELLTELGFRTQSSRRIPEHKVARYFGSPFEGKNQNQSFAFCYANHERGENDFVCSFSYFGIHPEQLATVRRSISANKDAITHKFETIDSNPKIILLFFKNQDFAKNIEFLLAEKFAEIQVKNFKNFEEVVSLLPQEQRGTFFEEKLPFSGGLTATIQLNKVDKKIEECSGVKELFLSYEQLANINKNGPIFEEEFTGLKVENFKIELDESGGEHFYFDLCFNNQEQETLMEEAFLILSDDEVFSERLANIIRHLEKGEPKRIIFLEEAITTYGDMSKSEQFLDVITLPIDRFYVTRKLKMHFPFLKLKSSEDNSRQGVPVDKNINTALPVQLKSISEIHLSFLYPRAIRLGDIRRFLLWMPNKKNLPTILAVCRHSEKVDKDQYLCQFLFFGVSDVHTRQIRQWIHEEYVEKKLEEQSGQ